MSAKVGYASEAEWLDPTTQYVELLAVRRANAPRPLWRAGVAVPAAVVLALLGPSMVSMAALPADWLVRLVVEMAAFGLAAYGWWAADGADVSPSVADENLRILLVLGGMIGIMFAGALGWLAFMETLSRML